LGINQPAVTIKQNEKSIVEHGFQEGWIRPEPAKVRTGKKVAVVAPARLDWPPLNNFAAPDTQSWSTKKPIASAVCSATHPRVQAGKAHHTTGVSSRCPPRA